MSDKKKMKFKGEKRVGGKLTKERFIVIDAGKLCS